MRQGQNSKRSRGRGPGSGSGSGSGRRSNVPARHQTFDSNGPSVRIRGSAFQVHEKYLTMARDAATAGDRIAAENYQQHAEHYFRIINADNDGDARGRADNPRNPGQHPRDDEFSGYDDPNETGEAVVETVTPPPSNGADGGDIGEGSEQPVVEFPNGEDMAANGSAGEEAKAPVKPRAPRGPRTPRTPHGRSRGPRASAKSDDGETPPGASDD